MFVNDNVMKTLITAGPTREMIDEVRFISNLASGQLGIYLAEMLADKMHEVILVLGPTHLKPRECNNLRIINVISAEDMYHAVNAEFANVDVFIATAAVADYRPKYRIKGKIKKNDDSRIIELVRTPDILKEMGALKDKQFIIGFALEADNPLENAQNKLLEKNCDVIVLNSPANLGETGKDKISFVKYGGIYKSFDNISKIEQAREINKLFTT